MRPPSELEPMILDEPADYQIIQQSAGTGDIAISGRLYAGSGSVEAKFGAGDWTTIGTVSGKSFSGTLSGQSAGVGALQVRLVSDTSINATIDNIGIGDVFVIAGQSNASGYTSAAAQTWSHVSLFAGLFGNDYEWRLLADPVDNPSGQVDTVSLDEPAINGSYWPLLTQYILDNAAIPVAFVPCPLGSSTIADWQPGADHQDRTTLYGSMIYRALQVGGVKAVLWHQGESDATVTGFTGGTAYNAYLDTLADSIASDLGVPLVAAKIHKWDGAPTTSQDNVDEINGAINTAWGDNSNVLAGPNLDSPTRITDALHFSTADELADAAGRWWTALSALFYS